MTNIREQITLLENNKTPENIMKMQEVTSLRKGDVVRFKWENKEAIEVVTKEWGELIEIGGWCVTTTGYRITCHNRHLFTMIA